MNDRDDHHDLSDVKARIEAAKRAQEIPDKRAEAGAKAVGARAGIELLVSIVFMGFIGWALDRSFDTAPWLMVVFFILGMVGGFRNAMRTAEQEAKKSQDSNSGENAK